MNTDERGVADVPVQDGRVASLLSAAAAPTEPGPQPGEAAALAAFRASQPTPRRSSMHSIRTRTKVAAAATLGAGLLLTGGVGAAAAGSLPGAAQDTASEMLAAVGIEVPGADEHSAGHSDERGQSDEQSPATEDETSTDDSSADDAQGEDSGKGAAVSELARTTESEGVDKGAEISGFASGGNSQAGQHGGSDEAAPDDTDAAQPPVDAPNDGGTGTADGAASSGTGTADEASSGHSTAGSDNRP